jgi:putative flavoprotein involved in K+ transport
MTKAEKTCVLVVGGGQAGVATSEHLSKHGLDHIVLERGRIAERWRSERWDSLVANGPAWHDRFPGLEFPGSPNGFPGKETVAKYFEDYAAKFKAPLRTGVNVLNVQRNQDRSGFRAETSAGAIEADFIVGATGPFQKPIIPPVVPETPGLLQMHSTGYRNPAQLQKGAVLIVGAGSSGSQIADELLRAGRKTFLCVGPHDRPPRAYRGRDFVWWLGVLGKWDAVTPPAGREHVTIAVSGAYGGATVDFRRFAARGMNLLGSAATYRNGVLTITDDLVRNIESGDANYLSVLEEADAYIARMGLDLPEETEAKIIGPPPPSMINPVRELDLKAEGISTIIWATGFAVDYSWLQVDAFDDKGRPVHQRGISKAPGVYFVGLPWLSRRGSSFIWGVWHDAKFVADQIAIQQAYAVYRPS